MNFGDMIVEIRKSKGLKQKDLAKILEIPATTLSKIENNERIPGTKNLEKLSEALGVPYQILLLRTLDEDEISTEKQQHFKEIIDIIDNNFINLV